MSTLHSMAVNFRLDELMEEYQLQIVRFVNQAASTDAITREHLFQQLNKLDGLDADVF